MFGIIAIHLMVDFMASLPNVVADKSKNKKALAIHAFLYASLLTVCLLAVYIGHPVPNTAFEATIPQGLACLFIFFGLTGLCHFVTDQITSFLYRSVEHEYKSDESFASATAELLKFTGVIALDQFVHIITVYGTLRLLGFPV